VSELKTSIVVVPLRYDDGAGVKIDTVGKTLSTVTDIPKIFVFPAKSKTAAVIGTPTE
jgi:hypothetical protein